jgi:hypothetical protein
VAISFTNFAPFDAGPGADVQEDQWRRFMRHMMASGVISGQGSELDVYADSTGMQVKIPPGEVWIRGHWGEFATEQAYGIATAPTGAGETRIDRVIARADFGRDLIEADVLTGTATTGTPTPPALTQTSLMWEIPIKQVTVAAGVITIAAGDVTADERLLVGEIATSNRPSLQLTRDTDLALLTNDYTVVPWTDMVRDNTGMWAAASPSIITIKKAGLWSITGRARISPNTSNSRLAELAVNNTASGSTSGAAGGAAEFRPGRGGYGTPISVTLDKELAVGDVVRLYLYQDSGVDLTSLAALGPVGMSLDAYWIGPNT